MHYDGEKIGSKMDRISLRSYLMRSGWMVRLYWDIGGERWAKQARNRIWFSMRWIDWQNKIVFVSGLVHSDGSWGSLYGVWGLVDSFLLSARSFILCNFEIECLPETLICRSTFSTHSIRTTISYDRILAAASDKGNANFDTIEPASYLADWIGVWAVTWASWVLIVLHFLFCISPSHCLINSASLCFLTYFLQREEVILWPGLDLSYLDFARTWVDRLVRC